jgi:hypothetical protein
MYYPLGLFKTVNEGQLKKLQAIGVSDTDALLNLTHLPSDRETLARRTGIGVDEITRLASLSDLVRIKGISLRLAELLVESGLVGNVQKFLELTKAGGAAAGQTTNFRPSESPVVKAAVANLVQKLNEFAKGRGDPLVGNLLHLLVESAEEALELKPRLVMNSRDDNDDFRKKVFEQWRDEHRFVWKTNPWYILIIGSIFIIPMLGMFLLFYLRARAVVSNPMDVIFNNYILSTLYFMAASFLIIMIILLLLAALIYSGWRLYSYLMDTHVKVLLFNAKIYQLTYDAIQPDIKKQKIISWIVMVCVGVFGGWQVWDLIQSSEDFTQFLILFDQRLLLFGILIGAVIVFPTFLKLVSFRRKDVSKTAIQRFIVFTIVYISALPVILLLGTRFMVPVSLQLHTSIMEKIVNPRFQVITEQAIKSIAGYSTKNDQEEFLKQDYLFKIAEFGEEVPDNLLLISPEIKASIMGQGLRSLNRAILAIFGMAFVFIYLLPYLVYGGIGKGVYYILLLLISLRLDDYLQANSPSWFGTSLNPVVSTIIIYVCLLSSALFFDWLYDYFTDIHKFCPSCSQELGYADQYCGQCGMVLPHAARAPRGLFKLFPARVLRRN